MLYTKGDNHLCSFFFHRLFLSKPLCCGWQQSVFCNSGGFLIQLVVATTLLTFRYDPSSFTITVGSNQLDAGGTPYAISKLIFGDYDAAILRTEIPIDFTAENVGAVSLPTENTEADVEVILAGWGDLGNGTIPNNLQVLRELRTLSDEECEQRLWPNAIGPHLVCAVGSAGDGACNGDSGGPLVDKNNTLVGLVSGGVPCARGFPDIYTRVYSFLDWIHNNTEE